MVWDDVLTEVTNIAKKLAKNNLNQKYAPAHLVKALLNPAFNFMKELDAAGIDVFYLDEWADIRIGEYPKASRPFEDPQPDSSVLPVIEEAETLVSQNGADNSFAALLGALVTPGVGFSHDQLKSLPISPSDVKSAFSQGGDSVTNNQEAPSPSVNSSFVDKYCIDKIRYRHKESTLLIGRDDELKTITEVLNRKLKPHIIIIGDSGVGKSTLIDGFCNRIADKTILTAFNNAVVYEINIGALFAGASYKGEVEDRLQKIFNEIRKHERPIIFIDDIHELFDSNQGSGIASIIKSELSKGDITFMGATTTDKYRKTLGKDDALSRRFETLTVTEPSQELALRMINNVIPYYQEHHNFTIDEEGLKESIRLSKRFLKERSLPDSALDLIDRTMSSLKVAKELLEKDLPGLKQQAADLALVLDEHASDEKLTWLYDDIISKSGRLLNGDETASDFTDIVEAQAKLNHINTLIEKMERLVPEENIVTAAHLSIIVSGLTGIPAGKVKSNERERLLEIENTLKQRVIGQDHAVKVVADAILESRSGLTKPGQPIGSFFFLGPTGTGKTELAKSLADFLFGDESAIIRFDMSEFKEEHSAALLYGAPPGYVGYEEGGLLVNKIRQKPYSIVLFDEIEKAHKSVFDVFLQILDEGKLHDRLGKEGDFSNAVILFTSNIGSDHIVRSFEKDIIPASNDLIQIMSGFFRPEFLGRLTEIIPFAPISIKSVSRIFDIHLKKELLQLLDKLDISLEINDEDKERIALQGFSPEYGARPIKGTIRNKLKRPLSRMIIANEIQKGDTLKVTVDETGELKFEKINEGSVL